MSLLIKNCWYCFVLPFYPLRKSAGYYFFVPTCQPFHSFFVFVVAKFTCIFGTREMINKGWIHLVQHVISFVPFGDWGTPLPEPFVSFFLPIRSITVQFNMVKKRQKLLYYQSFPILWYIFFFLLRHCERGETIFKKRRSLFFHPFLIIIIPAHNARPNPFQTSCSAGRRCGQPRPRLLYPWVVLCIKEKHI